MPLWPVSFLLGSSWRHSTPASRWSSSSCFRRRRSRWRRSRAGADDRFCFSTQHGSTNFMSKHFFLLQQLDGKKTPVLSFFYFCHFSSIKILEIGSGCSSPKRVKPCVGYRAVTRRFNNSIPRVEKQSAFIQRFISFSLGCISSAWINLLAMRSFPDLFISCSYSGVLLGRSPALLKLTRSLSAGHCSLECCPEPKPWPRQPSIRPGKKLALI